MYICLCHGFTDGDVRSAISHGCKSVAAVYRHLADRPQCGKCVPEVRCMVHEHREAQHGGAMLIPEGALAEMDGGAE